jgi:hypothetical protein
MAVIPKPGLLAVGTTRVRGGSMKRLIVLAIMLALPLSAGATNTVSKDGNFINVTFDGSTDFDMCAYLGVSNVTLYAIT